MSNVINLLFDYNLPLKRTCLLHLNKDESPTPKNILCHVWLKLAQCFWREFLDFFNVVLVFPLLSLFGKGRGPSFEQTWIPFTLECFVSSLGEIGLVVLEKTSKM